jgi:alpha-tubulin suppressor-like RCC1 family protein
MLTISTDIQGPYLLLRHMCLNRRRDGKTWDLNELHAQFLQGAMPHTSLHFIMTKSAGTVYTTRYNNQGYQHKKITQTDLQNLHHQATRTFPRNRR